MNILLFVIVGVVALLIGLLFKKINQSPYASFSQEQGSPPSEDYGHPSHVGLEGMRGEFIPLLQIGSGYTQTRRHSFSTTSDNQREIRFGLYKGYQRVAKENQFIGSFTVSDIPPGPAGARRVGVDFTLVDGERLEVKAYDQDSEKELPIYQASY